MPISDYFQVKPEFCRGNRFGLADRTFTLHSKTATIVGLTPVQHRRGRDQRGGERRVGWLRKYL